MKNVNLENEKRAVTIYAHLCPYSNQYSNTIQTKQQAREAIQKGGK